MNGRHRHHQRRAPGATRTPAEQARRTGRTSRQSTAKRPPPRHAAKNAPRSAPNETPLPPRATRHGRATGRASRNRRRLATGTTPTGHQPGRNRSSHRTPNRQNRSPLVDIMICVRANHYCFSRLLRRQYAALMAGARFASITTILVDLCNGVRSSPLDSRGVLGASMG